MVQFVERRLETLPRRLKSLFGQPAWDVAEFYPAQGYWDEEDYLALDVNRHIEFTDGVIEVLPLPTTSHQDIVIFLLTSLMSFVNPRKLGKVTMAPLPVRMRKDKYREPDIVFMSTEHADRVKEQYWQSADLVMEVVSPDAESRRRDFRRKRGDYRRARIPEYWIVDPAKHEITVLQLKGRRYLTAQKVGRGDRVASVLLKGFEVEVDKVFESKKR